MSLVFISSALSLMVDRFEEEEDADVASYQGALVP